jgi:hypothetical protein
LQLLLLQAFWKQEEKEGHHWLIVCNFWTEEHNMADSWDPFVLVKKAGGVDEEQEAEKW